MHQYDLINNSIECSLLFPYSVKILEIMSKLLLTEYERFAVKNNFESGVAKINFEEQILSLFLYPESLTEIIVMSYVNS